MIILGELEERLQSNRKRLKDATYCNPLIFNQGGEWPGDWQGRAILALANHYAVTTDLRRKNSIKRQLDDIILNLENHVNEDGYFGDKLDLELVNEQQISGNSWFLRGLCEYYLLFEDQKTLALINKIIHNYLLKLIPAYQKYPNIKREDGGVGGHLLKKVFNHWQLSSDVGCAYIMLDGASHAYQITKNKQLSNVIDVMIENFLKLDLVENNCQTHATLSATRGIMRFYQEKRDPVLLKNVKDIYQIYLNEGMTINYANINWFGKPSWTEPCAVVDSFILATQLFNETQEYKYLRLMNRIYYNALLVGQRKNGGAGCETCLMHKDTDFKIHLYEAYFCCSMRLAEGLKYVSTNLAFENENHITLAIMNDFKHAKFFNQDVDISLQVIKSELTQLKITIENSKNIEGYLDIYTPLGIRISSFSSEIDIDQMIRIPLTSKVFEITYSIESHEEKIKGELVQMQGDHLLMVKKNKHQHEVMTDYTKLNKNKAIKDIQNL